METIIFKEFNGREFKGFKITDLSELPKYATICRHTQNEHLDDYTIWWNLSENGIKYYIIKSL